jgi:hypothetical protein
MKHTCVMSSAVLFFLVMLLPIAAGAAIGGHYHGSMEGKAVTANFETQAGSISGTLTIGETHYILQAQKSGAGYEGTLVNISIGHGGTLQILEQGTRLNLEIMTEGEPSLHLELQPDGS